MRNRVKGIRAAWPLAIVAFLCFGVGSAGAKELGLDANGDLACNNGDGDMGQVWGEGDLDSTICFDVIVSDAPDCQGFGISWCVRDKNKVNYVSFEYTVPEGWNTSELQNSDDNPATCPVDQVYADDPALQGKILCWLAQGFTTDPGGFITTFPTAIGTFCYNVTGTPDYKAGFLCQGPNSGWFGPGGAEDFDGELCTPASSVDRDKSWGTIKKLFR